MGAGTPRPRQCDPVAALMAAFVVGSGAGVEVSGAAIGASVEDSTVVPEAEVTVAATAGSAAHPVHRADLATAEAEAEADTAADLTVIAETMEEAVDTADAMMTDPVAASAAVSIDLALVATLSPLDLDTATAVAVVGIATEAMTIAETTPGSAHTRAVRATRESGNCVDTNDNGISMLPAVLWWVS